MEQFDIKKAIMDILKKYNLEDLTVKIEGEINNVLRIQIVNNDSEDLDNSTFNDIFEEVKEIIIDTCPCTTIISNINANDYEIVSSAEFNLNTILIYVLKKDKLENVKIEITQNIDSYMVEFHNTDGLRLNYFNKIGIFYSVKEKIKVFYPDVYTRNEVAEYGYDLSISLF